MTGKSTAVLQNLYSGAAENAIIIAPEAVV